MSDIAVHFPPRFLWGSATASHQVEGDNRWNDWWEYEQDGRVAHRSGAACDHFHEFAADFSLAQSLGQNAHRLSLEWSRIEPHSGRWNESAIEHYAAVPRGTADPRYRAAGHSASLYESRLVPEAGRLAAARRSCKLRAVCEVRLKPAGR
jgi:hypothetical protein